MINYSIIIPHYNIPHLLKRCINSIPVREDIEVIIVDDNSKNEIVDFDNFPGKERPNFTIIFNDKNKGAGYSRNKAISIAKGKWILCVDADDFLQPKAFENIDKYKNSNYDVVIFKSDSCLSDNIMQKGTRNSAEHHNILVDDCINKKISVKELLYRIHSPWCKLVKRSTLNNNKIEFTLNKLGGEDVMWSIKIAHFAISATCDNSIIYCLTERDNSLSINKDLQSILNAYNVTLEKNKFFKMHNLPKYISFFSYNYFINIAHISKITFIIYIIKSIKEQMIEPICFYNIEKKLGFKYPYIYIVLMFLEFPSIKNNYLRKLWRKIC